MLLPSWTRGHEGRRHCLLVILQRHLSFSSLTVKQDEWPSQSTDPKGPCICWSESSSRVCRLWSDAKHYIWFDRLQLRSIISSPDSFYSWKCDGTGSKVLLISDFSYESLIFRFVTKLIFSNGEEEKFLMRKWRWNPSLKGGARSCSFLYRKSCLSFSMGKSSSVEVRGRIDFMGNISCSHSWGRPSSNWIQ